MTPTTSQSLLVVYAKWVPDGNARTGPEPGYRPAFSGLTSHDMQRATAAIDPSGTQWIVSFSFTARGRALFAQLTHDNVAACPSDYCPERHLGTWLDLTQTDIDRWDDPTFADTVSQPFDLDCLTHMTAATACPKLVTDALTLQEIDGGSSMIGGDLTQQSANQLADAINATSHS
jgi:preprotein translocase subunit SecD